VVSTAQMIITRWGPAEAVSLSSPQLPGIVAAFDDDPSATEVFHTAVAAGLDPDGDVEVHVEDVLLVKDVQYFVRARHDFRAEARIEVAQRIVDQITHDDELRDYAVPDVFGDVLLIAALPSDSISATLASAENGQPIVVASVDPDEDRVVCVAIVRNSAEPNGPTLEALGLSDGSTVHALLQMKSKLRNHSRDHELVQA
jgi:hypothetical protein